MGLGFSVSKGINRFMLNLRILVVEFFHQLFGFLLAEEF